MAIQITKIISANGIRNGGVLVQGTAKFPLDQALDQSSQHYDSANPLPSITDIQSKYDARFDNLRYYSGDLDT